MFTIRIQAEKQFGLFQNVYGLVRDEQTSGRSRQTRSGGPGGIGSGWIRPGWIGSGSSVDGSGLACEAGRIRDKVLQSSLELPEA